MKKCQPRRKQLSLECFEPRLCLTIPTFTAYTIDEGLGGATDVELADIDRDGDLDIVVASFDDDEVSWYETLNGSGEFGEPILVTRDADGAIAVATGDFDGDGDLDLVSSSYLDGRIAWYENTNGDGRFGDPKLIAKGEDGKLGFVPDENHDFSASLAAADVDGDGDVDVLSGSFRDFIFTWYENDGGDFSEHHSTPGEATAMRVADLDGDGDLDVLGSSVFAVAWYENGGAGLFSAEHILSTELGTAVGDMDGDGDLDVAYDTLDDGYVWRENLGDDAPFGSPQPIHCSCDGSPTTIIDLNADGIAEIVNESSVFENSNGMWEEHWLGGQNDFSSVSAFGDVDGDGDTDLVKLTDLTRFGSENSHELQWYSSSLTDVTVHDLPNDSRVRGLVDLDSDGDLDFLGGTEWLENDRESGSFESHPLAIEAGGVMVDLDGDDDLDVLLYSTNDDPTIQWQENVDGAGNFSDALPAGTGLGRLLGLGDLDSDGDLDILSSANEEIAWHKNVGETGVFDVRRVIAKVPGSMRLSLGDLDGDGDVDLLVSSYTYDEVSHALIDQEIFWLENLGNAESFSEKQVIATDVDSVVDVDIADMDGDGDLDVLAGEYKRGISWYDNLNGKGSFGEKKVIGELLPYEGVYSIEVLDMDNDGDLDVVAAGSDVGPQHVTWYENLDGTATLFAHQTIGHANHIVGVGDIDGDGDLDILTERLWIENHLSQDRNPRLPGDANEDGQVNFADFLLLAANFGELDAVWSDGDFDGDREVTLTDFVILVENFERLERQDTPNVVSPQNGLVDSRPIGNEVIGSDMGEFVSCTDGNLDAQRDSRTRR